MEETNAWIEINYDHLKHNVQTIQKLLPKETTFMAVVKANAYGHGAIPIAKYLNTIGIHAFAVARIEEAMALRKAGVTGEILILGYTSPEGFASLYDYDIIQTVVDSAYAKELEKTKKPIKIHLKIDTGMHRLGISQNEISEIVKISTYKYLKIEGIFTHLCVCDSEQKEDIIYTNKQIDTFYTLLESLKKQGINSLKTHIQSSYGVLNYPQLTCDYARIGIAMYGTLSSSEQKLTNKVLLKPVLAMKSRIISMHTISAGESIGYGRSYVCKKTTRVAVVGIGYADGVPRCLGENQGYVLVSGKRAPIVGRICMDQMMIDVSTIEEATSNSEVTIIGTDYETIWVADIANKCHTITNEILSRLGNRLPRRYQKEKQYATQKS